jgi:hypothetical protein
VGRTIVTRWLHDYPKPFIELSHKLQSEMLMTRVYSEYITDVRSNFSTYRECCRNPKVYYIIFSSFHFLNLCLFTIFFISEPGEVLKLIGTEDEDKENELGKRKKNANYSKKVINVG